MIGIGIISRLQKNMNSLKKDDINRAMKEIFSNRVRIKRTFERESRRIFETKKTNELLIDALKMSKRVSNELNTERNEENN